jgi:hypothetical protein
VDPALLHVRSPPPSGGGAEDNGIFILVEVVLTGIFILTGILILEDNSIFILDEVRLRLEVRRWILHHSTSIWKNGEG